MDAQTHPGKGLSLSQLVFALNEELKRTAHSPSFTLQAVSQLDKDISTALATIREWGNSFVHINRIPLDILSLIPTHLSSQKDRFRVSFVCRHWRRTFLQRADLWSQLFLYKGEVYVKTLLGRVRGSPLDITIAYTVPVSTMALLSPHTEQIRKLCFPFYDREAIQTFSSSGPFPLLHTLDIHLPRPPRLGDSRRIIPPPVPLFSDAVNLKAFRFHSGSEVAPSLSQFTFPNIVTFDFHARPNNVFQVRQLLDFLEGSPMLQTVQMYINSEISLEGAPRERVVLLPKVETFKVTLTDGEPGYEFVTRISCPSAKSTFLLREIPDCRTIPEDIFPTSVPLDTIIHRCTSSLIEKVELDIKLTSDIISGNITFQSTRDACVNLGFNIFLNDDDEDYEDESIPLSTEAYREAFTQATGTIRNYSQLSKVKRFKIYHNFPSISLPFVANEVGRLFKALYPLDELTLHRCNLRHYSLPLTDMSQEAYIDELVVLPPIRELIISHPQYLSGRQFNDVVMGLAISHYMRGIPFERMVISSYSLPEGMKEALVPWVGQVECWYERLVKIDDD